MQLARPGFDIGLFTRLTDAQLRFWQDTAGLRYDHLGKLGGGLHQHRHHLHGVILKLNAARDPLPAFAPCGLRALRIARAGCVVPQAMHDPDGTPVTFVPPGDDGTEGVDVMMTVSDVGAHRAFYRDAFGFAVAADGTVDAGPVRLRVATVAPVARSPDWRGPGLRYLTLQVPDVRAARAAALDAGAAAADPLRDLGDLVRYCFVRDPDGNFIELSERTTYTGRPLCP
ncbi:MAG: VOC family protein [Gammaproteobacteria bacterium]|nr:VOC family protein [Gammaproteobacteria bacterium]